MRQILQITLGEVKTLYLKENLKVVVLTRTVGLGTAATNEQNCYFRLGKSTGMRVFGGLGDVRVWRGNRHTGP
jgi:hypothetical protein